MRHVPTSIYIDTQFFKSHGLRFDTREFSALRNEFSKGGLRLLVPEMMERELLRHFSRQAEKSAKDLEKAHEDYYISRIDLATIPSSEEIVARCTKLMLLEWSSFKEHFVVEALPLAGDIQNVVTWYFECSPPFSEKKNKEFPDAFILSALDQYHNQHHANIAVVSHDTDFKNACTSRRYMFHFLNLDNFINAFRPELSGKERLPGEIDLTKPITTEDLTQLKAILSQRGQTTQIEVERVMSMLGSRGSNYDYFFQHADDPAWLSPLLEKGYFLDPPDVEETTEGYCFSPAWPPIEYLVRVFDLAPSEVMNIVLGLQKTNNCRVLECILEIALKSGSSDAIAKLSHSIPPLVENCRPRHDLIVKFLKSKLLFDAKLSDVTPALLLKIVEFRRDPREHEKHSRKQENPQAWDTLLEPTPHFDQWEYRQVLEQGIRPLADSEPYQVSRILIDAVAAMLRLGMHPEDFEERRDEDLSEIWCPRLDSPDRNYQNTKELLLQSLAYACDKVYDKAQESIEALDQAMRNHRWKLFKRLRQYLYALHPNSRTLPWIREQILQHEGYSKWQHGYEFQLMISKAAEKFGGMLLSDSEKKGIIDAILSGPSKSDFREFSGERYSEADFQRNQRYFHRIQLRPFLSLLNEDIRCYFEDLENEALAEGVTDDSYSLDENDIGGEAAYRSPKSVEELAKLSDNDLLTYLNDWEDEYRDKKNWLIEVNIFGLANAFQTLFTDKIVQDCQRLSFWITNRDRIERPVYVTAMLAAMTKLVKQQDFSNVGPWTEFCTWVLSHPDSAREDGLPEPREESRDHPDWSFSRRSVVDFIYACLDKDANTPITAREGLADLLRMACSQPDWRLDHDNPVLLTRNDPITEAINNTRSRALESLINFGFWIRRHSPEDRIHEVTEILDSRLHDQTKAPITLPEHALLGMHFGNLFTLDPDWTASKQRSLFPRYNEGAWLETFRSYIRFNRPLMQAFKTLRSEFEHALGKVDAMATGNSYGKELVDRLGQHIFSYYLWKVYPLVGDNSLLEKFYSETSNDRKAWANLFDHVGRSLRNSGKHLDQDLKDRVIEFFNWRLEAAEPDELCEFSFWLSADCLDPIWRLESFSKILDITVGYGSAFSVHMAALNKLLPDHLELVVECFAKITDAMNGNRHIFISSSDANPILLAGLQSESDIVREQSERAKDNLLSQRRFEFLEVGV